MSTFYAAHEECHARIKEVLNREPMKKWGDMKQQLAKPK